MEETPRSAEFSFFVQGSGLFESIWVHFNDGTKLWAVQVDLFDACEIGLGEVRRISSAKR